MIVETFTESAREECASFWWSIYKDKQYVIRPDAYQNVQSHAHLGPDYFLRYLDSGVTSDPSLHWSGDVTYDSIFMGWSRLDRMGSPLCCYKKQHVWVWILHSSNRFASIVKQ